MSTTFFCPFCGAPITGSVAGATFACPYCRAKVMAPVAGGAAPAPSSAAAASSAGTAPFSGELENVQVTVDPQLGPIALGVSAGIGRPAAFRAWDMRARRVLWEALPGAAWLEQVTIDAGHVIGRNVYLANRRQLLCFDLVTGNSKWQATLSDAPGNHRPSLEVADPFPPGQRGAILVPTVDNQVFSLDRDSGQVLWSRSFGERPVFVEPVLGQSTCVVRHNGTYTKAEIVNPAYPQALAALGHDHWSTDLGKCRVSGRTVLTVVDDMGSEGDDDGLLCFDAVSGQVHFFDEIEDLEEDVIPVAMGPRAFAAMDDGAALYVGPRGRPIPPPVPNHAIAAMMQAGPTLVLLLKKAQGTPTRRIVGIDPTSLAFRFDLGEAGTEPDHQWERQWATDGYSLVFVATPNDDLASSELRSVDTTTGRLLWSRPCPRWRGHRFASGAIVLRTATQIEVLSPQNGQPIAVLGPV